MSMGNATHWTSRNLLVMAKLLVQTQAADQQLKERRGPPYPLMVDDQKEKKTKIYYH